MQNNLFNEEIKDLELRLKRNKRKKYIIQFLGLFVCLLLVIAWMIGDNKGVIGRFKSGFQVIFQAKNLIINKNNNESAKSSNDNNADWQDNSEIQSQEASETQKAEDVRIKELFDSHSEEVPVTCTGIVTRLLADDTEGSRHQKFIIQLSSGQTLMIVHNIDIAPRVEPINIGDSVSISGKYVYNEQGGLVHWTHHDPDGSEAGGKITVNGNTFS